MIVREMVESDPRRAANEREKLRYCVVRDMRSAGRWDASDLEVEAELDRREADLARRRAAERQLQLPLLDVGQVAAETKRASCAASRSLRISVRARVTELLEHAGTGGLTREQLAQQLGVKEGTVSAAVRYLLDQDVACEPTKRISSCGNPVAVVVLRQCIGGRQ